MLSHLTSLLKLSTPITVSTAFINKKGGRDHNEDYLGKQQLENGNSCWIVADGLGGHGAGEIAAKLTVQTVLENFTQQSDISIKKYPAFT